MQETTIPTSNQVVADVSPGAVLRALAAHVEAYPELEHSLSHVTTRTPYVQLHPWGGGTMLSVLADWARSLMNAGDIKVTSLPTEESPKVHLEIGGKLRDGTRMLVVALPDANESQRILAASGCSAVGDTFPIEVLVRVVNA
jgi:hypothetical protein